MYSNNASFVPIALEVWGAAAPLLGRPVPASNKCIDAVGMITDWNVLNTVEHSIGGSEHVVHIVTVTTRHVEALTVGASPVLGGGKITGYVPALIALDDKENQIRALDGEIPIGFDG
jgi:hypothetical protein